jgi:plastocyanin
MAIVPTSCFHGRGQTFWWLLTALALSVLLACGGGGETAGESAEGAASAPADRPATSSGPTAPTGTASISGTISYEGEVPELRPLSMNADPKCEAKHSEPVYPEVLVLGADNTMAWVMVSVKSGLPEGSYSLPSEPVVIDQQGCQYLPHVLGMQTGQTLKILNSDSLLHNIHSLSEVNPPFNRAMPATVMEAEYTMEKEEGMFHIKCDVHPWMSAYAGVFRHPYFSVTGEDGQFTLSGLPAGTYELEAWHERLGAQTATVTVADGEAASTNFTFTR